MFLYLSLGIIETLLKELEFVFFIKITNASLVNAFPQYLYIPASFFYKCPSVTISGIVNYLKSTDSLI